MPHSSSFECINVKKYTFNDLKWNVSRIEVKLFSDQMSIQRLKSLTKTSQNPQKNFSSDEEWQMGTTIPVWMDK